MVSCFLHWRATAYSLPHWRYSFAPLVGYQKGHLTCSSPFAALVKGSQQDIGLVSFMCILWLMCLMFYTHWISGKHLLDMMRSTSRTSREPCSISPGTIHFQMMFYFCLWHWVAPSAQTGKRQFSTMIHLDRHTSCSQAQTTLHPGEN